REDRRKGPPEGYAPEERGSMHMTEIKAAIGPVVGIVQARMGSTRLPGKVMREIGGKPMLWHVVTRLRAAALVDKAVVATTDHESEDVIAEWCAENEICCHRGSVNDVLDRYFYAALGYKARTIVRITSDCPLLDPALVDRAIGKFAEGGLDYVSIDPT